MIHGSSSRTHNIGDTIPSSSSNPNTQVVENGKSNSIGDNSNASKHKKRGEEKDGEDEDGKDDEDGRRDTPTPNPKRRKGSRKNGQFKGTVTLHVNESLKQNLTIAFGIRICPSLRHKFVDCRVILDPITVLASALFSDDDKEGLQDPTLLNYFYTTERVSIIVGNTQVSSLPPAFIHPLRQHFAERRTVSTKNQFDCTLEASANPKFTLKGSRGSGKTVEYDPVTLSLEVEHIGAGQRNDIIWQYRAIGGIGAILELSSSNPPIHEATFRVDCEDAPESFKVITHAIFKQNGKLGRQKTPSMSAAARVLRDLRAMHIIAELKVNVENNDNDWFLFPADNKTGCSLSTEVRIDRGKLKDSKPDELKSPAVVAKLSSQVSSSG
jgi:hypothetical protein